MFSRISFMQPESKTVAIEDDIQTQQAKMSIFVLLQEDVLYLVIFKKVFNIPTRYQGKALSPRILW